MDKDRGIERNAKELRRKFVEPAISVQVSIPLHTEGFAVSTERGLVYNDEVGMATPWRKPGGVVLGEKGVVHPS